jgi:hypothetical protein
MRFLYAILFLIMSGWTSAGVTPPADVIPTNHLADYQPWTEPAVTDWLLSNTMVMNNPSSHESQESGANANNADAGMEMNMRGMRHGSQP